MKLSEILNSLKKKTPVKIWRPKLWVPDPMDYPVTVHILSDEKFEIAAKAHKYNKRIGAFAVWGTDSEGERVSSIYMRYHKLNLFNHEVRHLQEGHFHD